MIEIQTGILSGTQEGLTFEADFLGQVYGAMSPAEAVLSIAATRGHHLVKSNDSVAGLELGNIVADFMDNTRDVIALINGLLVWHPFWTLPGIG